MRDTHTADSGDGDTRGVAVELLALGAATVGESGGRPMHPRIHAAWPGARLAGPALPVRCSPGDNLAIHVAVARAPARKRAGGRRRQ